MKIKKAFLEYDNCAGDGYVISGKYYTASGFSFLKTLGEYLSKSRQRRNFINKHKDT